MAQRQIQVSNIPGIFGNVEANIVVNHRNSLEIQNLQVPKIAE
jgi:hypothetical protein